MPMLMREWKGEKGGQLLQRNLLSDHRYTGLWELRFLSLIVNKGSLHPQFLWDMTGEDSKRRH